MTPIVFLHGFGGSRDSFDEVAELLSGMCVALDLYGHRARPEPRRIADFDQGAEALAQEIDGLGMGPVQLVGYSLGGRLALAIALRWPERVARLSLIGAHPGLTSDDERRARVDADDTWAKLLEKEGTAAFFERWNAQAVLQTAGAVKPERRAAKDRIQQSHHPLALASALRAFGLGKMPELGARVEELTMPVDWIAGGHDEKYLAIATAMASRVGRLCVVPSCGHDPILEQPEALAAILEANA